MSLSSPSIHSLSFLLPGSFTDENPYEGLEGSLALFEHGEALGFDGGWVRQHHLVSIISSAPVFLAAASQRTERIELGTAVIPIGSESPFRLAEDLSLLDVLSRGRLQAGLSASAPMDAAANELLGGLVFDGDWHSYDFGHGRISRLIENLSGRYLGDEEMIVPHPNGPQRPRLRPHAAGLSDRLWYGAGRAESVRWAAENGLNLVVGNITSGTGLGTEDFATAQSIHISNYRERFAAEREPRVVTGRVIVPTDGASAASERKYREYQARRHARTLKPFGDQGYLIAPDLVGSADEILTALHADPVIANATELQIELPFAFSQDEYEQILSDVVGGIAPALGWSPSLVPG